MTAPHLEAERKGSAHLAAAEMTACPDGGPTDTPDETKKTKEIQGSNLT